MSNQDYFSMISLLDDCEAYQINRELIETSITQDISNVINLACLEKFSLSERLIMIYFDTLDMKSISIINNLKYLYRLYGISEVCCGQIRSLLGQIKYELNNQKAFNIKKRVVGCTYTGVEEAGVVRSWINLKDSKKKYKFHRNIYGAAKLVLDDGYEQRVITTLELRSILGLEPADEGIQCIVNVHEARILEAVLISLGRRDEISDLVVHSHSGKYSGINIRTTLHWKESEKWRQ